MVENECGIVQNHLDSMQEQGRTVIDQDLNGDYIDESDDNFLEFQNY